jgi:hypothetical protein
MRRLNVYGLLKCPDRSQAFESRKPALADPTGIRQVKPADEGSSRIRLSLVKREQSSCDLP